MLNCKDTSCQTNEVSPRPKKKDESEIARKSILEMTSLSQSPRDRILWILASNGGKMERSRLGARTEMYYQY
jgi:hypothetical protein